jgi:hypothetical protein
MTKKWLTIFIQSHLFLAVSAFIFSIGILKRSDLALHFSLALAFAVFGVYNLNRLNKIKKNQLANEMRFWYEQHSVILGFTAKFSLFIAALIYIYLLEKETILLLLLGATGLITLLYIFSVRKINLRQIPGTKALWISIIWTLIAVVIPNVNLHHFSWGELHYFILFFALTIPGDMRDKLIDDSKMKTIPQLIGNRNAILLFYFIIGLFLILSFFLNSISIIGIFAVISVLPFLFSICMLFRYELVDGILLILGVCYLIK